MKVLASDLVRGEDDPLLPHLVRHLAAARGVDIVVAFALESGVRQLEAHLRDSLQRGGTLRLLTGDSLDITEPSALMRLLDLEDEQPEAVQLRVFESQGTSFHPKAYIFLDVEGDGIAYVGSSNLSETALRTGVEWNYRVVRSADPVGFAAIVDAFERLFQHPQTRPLDVAWVDAYRQRRHRPELPTVDVPQETPQPPPEPHEIQRQALEALEQTRVEGNRTGLVVLATGLGKTWLAAFDSVRGGFHRVLFVAHRDEILVQARDTFRRIRPEAHLGLYTGKDKVPDAEVLFASVQTLSRRQHLRNFAPEHFDYIVVDEFHHAAAATYRRLIEHFAPRFLLGLTATPERADGGDLLALCGENLVYRCDLADGIGHGLLSPFRYFGVPDLVDYRNIPWRSNRFDEEELTRALATQARAQNALEQWRLRGGQRTLAFCCSQRHADFMASFFGEAGLRAVAVHSGPGSAPRTDSLERLGRGELDVLFAVDMFNEGVDVPDIDTVLMLRPTESRVLWLQQLGRGLRQVEGKKLSIIDYIGNHRTFLRKVVTLLEEVGQDRRELAAALERLKAGPQELSPGCWVTYDLEAIGLLEELLPRQPRYEALPAYYQDFRQQHGTRPRAVEAYHDGYNPRATRQRYGSWVRFVREMGNLGADLDGIEGTAADFLDALDTVPMIPSSRMLVLQALLAMDAMPGEIDLDSLVAGVSRIAGRSARLQADLGQALQSAEALRRHLEERPIAEWAGRKGTGFFTYESGRLRTTFEIPDGARGAFQELVRELVEWRLAEYLDRAVNPEPAGERYICKVSQSAGRPILFLPGRTQNPDLPMGPTPVRIDGVLHEVDFVKIAVNVVRRPGSTQNDLPRILRGWFGHDAGQPGTRHEVALERMEDRWRMVPMGEAPSPSQPVLWTRYAREQIPPLFGSEFSDAIWNMGFVSQSGHLFLLVTLDKEGLQESFHYRDHFLTADTFQWQSQNRATQANKAGQQISKHREQGLEVHLFVRRSKKDRGRAMPFVYCGEVDFVSWEGEQPITVQWRLRSPLPLSLAAEFSADTAN